MNIVVTGASSGIGYEVVKLLSLNPNNTIFAIARSADKLEKLRQECFTLNKENNVHVFSIDLVDKKANKDLLKKFSGLRSIDILLNNAGAILNKSFKETTREELLYIYEVNLFSPFLLIQSLLPLFSKNAHIVNISSMGGFQGSSKFAGLSAYSSSKAALVCLTECLSEELKETNIKINCLAIGAVQTPMLESAFPGYSAPLKASEMADFIVNFCLNGHKYFNGKVLPVSTSTP